MADTLQEQTRALHEDMERMERVIVKDLRRDTRTHKQKLMQMHRVKRRLDVIQEAARKLVKIYADEDGARKEEIAALANKDNPFAAFYDRLRDIRDYHRRFANLEVTEVESDEHLLKEEPVVTFTGEECLGRYLDLHSYYTTFLNSKFGNKCEYYEYVTGLPTHLVDVPRNQKLTAAYRSYVKSLLDYLISFYTRTQPLAQLTRQLTKIQDSTQDAFEAGTLPGWEDRGQGQVVNGTEGSGDIDLTAFQSVEELESIGAERLKQALMAKGLKCGGPPRERAERLWLTRTTPLHLLDKKLFVKGVLPPETSNGAQVASQATSKRQQLCLEVAVLDAQLAKVCELLANVISDTKGRIEKRQAQTYEEMLTEQEEAADEGGVVEEVSDNEDDFVYNPLKLPLGWDGKPIPYWLYKLHGLNQEFKCEICGNAVYRGRRAYERHFKEWRHQNGMRALGIPNTKAFFEITTIADAQTLWADVQAKQKAGFKAEVEEEYEDDDGNVYNKRTYFDLKKQGLI